MNIDEARALLKEHDDLKQFVQKACDNTGPDMSVTGSVVDALIPLATARVAEIDLLFNPQPVGPPPQPEPQPPVRQKVKPAVEEAFAKGAGDTNDESWKTWAVVRGFKWDSVRAVLKELRAKAAEPK